MRTLLLTLVFLLINSIGFSQAYSFKPTWEKGESKTANITTTEQEFKGGVKLMDTTYYNEIKINVLNESDTNYTIEVLMGNQALKAALVIYDKLDEELTDYNTLKLLYSVSKETGETELLNSAEAQQFMNKSFDQITKLLEEKAPDAARDRKSVV